MIKKLFIGSDHAGFELKRNLIAFIKSHFETLEISDLGPESADSVDYPDYAHKVCKSVLEAKSTQIMGLLICGSGQGMAITANKQKGIRAALCWTPEIAKLSREHNDANVLCLSSRHINENVNQEILKAFLSTEFEGGRHQNRINKI